ncbi:hypothetical protein BJ138DRAFT_1165743 [Hygrophoropsis aurantiaca]|uniref:Uncharacterized protein n=1 Tax=Hygrophoropsis aurantiaca TaxID=72124 RepID=A0ACB7ZVX2_9AGAM|nr:hypothetical protein BJ138DRAFT_1165743 [Hygrophoropsis aurantiaca]
MDSDTYQAIMKLRNYLRVAQDMGYSWAWVDAHCMDKTNAVELLESISSMFEWYSNAAITVVYLADVQNSSETQLLASDWFQRIWTLQELLAPRAILLFNSDWTPFRRWECHNRNDKCDSRMLELLEKASRIDKESLRNFRPNVDMAREMLAWASGREATRKEGAGYGLMNLFGVRLRVDYGEREGAFGRLLLKIYERTKNPSLFDWTSNGNSLSSSPVNSAFPAHPSCYRTPSNSITASVQSIPNISPTPLQVTCSVYNIQKIKPNNGVRYFQTNQWDVTATGFEPLQVHPTDIEEYRERSEYALVLACQRVKSAEAKSSFRPMLLEKNKDGTYRRIPTTIPITAIPHTSFLERLVTPISKIRRKTETITIL